MGLVKIPKKEPVYKVKVKFNDKKTFTFETHLPEMFKKGTSVTLSGKKGTVVGRKKTRKMSRL